jgi:hypothetical protein
MLSTGLGIGRVVVQQWTLCSSKLQEKSNSYAYCCISEGWFFAALFAA